MGCGSGILPVRSCVILKEALEWRRIYSSEIRSWRFLLGGTSPLTRTVVSVVTLDPAIFTVPERFDEGGGIHGIRKMC